MESMYNYSIIIPHKNIPELLLRCLDSIPRREDIQIIIVDDNSDPDKSIPAIILNNSGLKIISLKEGKGAGYARNNGLQHASGKWIIFADADDFFIENFLNATDKYLDSNYDLVYFGITDAKNLLNKRFTDAIESNNYDEYIFKTFVPYGKMIKRLLIVENNIVFDETMVANDRMFSLKTVFFAKNIFLEKDRVYFYDNTRPGSLISLHTQEANLDRFRVYIHQNAFFERIGKTKYKQNIITYIRHELKFYNLKILLKIIRILRSNRVNLIKEYREFYPSPILLICKKIFGKKLI